MMVTPFINQRFLRVFKCLIFLIIISYVIFSIFPSNSIPPKPRKPPKSVDNFTCPFELPDNDVPDEAVFHKNNATDQKILIILDSLFSRNGKQITQMLTALKLEYKAEAITKNLPMLTTSRKGKYSLIIIENYYKYLNMPRWNRQLLDKYCKEYNVPVFAFIASKPNDQLKRIRIKGSSLWMWQNQQIQSIVTSPSVIHKIGKVGTGRSVNNSTDWVLFETTNNYESVLTGKLKNGYERAVVVYDKGKEDGVERILFGRNITDWNIKLVFLDSLWWALGTTSTFTLDRYIQVDIDDVFVGAVGTRMVEDDVRQLITAQHYFRQHVDNFTFMLGFSGSYYKNGDELEDVGDESLIENAANFVWFPHMWRHNHAHDHNYTYLESIMLQNKVFAENMHLPVTYPYAIAPQHDGVFPVHEQMYDAWKKVWNVSVTATEEYPHFKPATARQAFIHKGISVLPRQTCGLYTHTQFFDSYPEGFDKIQNSIHGGDLFFTLLLNPISVFMTHQQNYAHDRLALYTFDNLFKFVKCWTNIKLKWQDPIASSELYFKYFPEEKTPLWSNPCVDPRHRAIVPPSINCSNITLPNLLILGPQKTGSTALASFLSMHPNVSQNQEVAGSFEEVQFFGGLNYNKGIEWYLSKFQNGSVIFEKSATYFDNPKSAKQAAALIPDAKLVIILHDPSKRAYSWYQHLLAHNDKWAIAATSLNVILDDTNSTIPRDAANEWKRIRQRCISGGKYIHHLEKWLENYPLTQIHFIDSDLLRDDPAKVLHDLTKWLDLSEFDYNSHIRFSPSKGYHCRLINGQTKCLGKSKGRNYDEMDRELKKKLNKLFSLDNSALYKFLRKNRLVVPTWLEESVRIRY